MAVFITENIVAVSEYLQLKDGSDQDVANLLSREHGMIERHAVEEKRNIPYRTSRSSSRIIICKELFLLMNGFDQ
jgi:hypothetical protein